MTTKSFRQLKVWQYAIEVVDAVYNATENFPKQEVYGLTQQLRRAAVSIASNIAEGSSRSGIGEFTQFLYIAKASLAEVETQLIIAQRRNYLVMSQLETLLGQLEIIEKMIVGLIRSIHRKQSTINNKLSTLEMESL